MADPHEVIRSELFSISQLPPGHRDQGRRLANAASKLIHLHKRTKSLEDLKQAVDLLRAAVEATPFDHVRRHKRLHNLAVNLGRLYRETRSASHLLEAIDIGREVSTGFYGNNADKARYLGDLGTAIWDRYQMTDCLGDLHEFIQISKEALSTCMRDSSYRFKLLNDVGVGLGEQHMKTGSLQDLEEAVTFAQASIGEILENHPNQARHLANLSVVIGDRFLITGSMDDLDSAIHYAKAAVDKATANHCERGIYLNNLAIRHLDRYDRSKSTTDWQAALDFAKSAVAATHPTDPKRAILLNNIAKCYHDRHKELGTSDLLEASVDYTRTAMRESRLSQGHTDQARRSFNLGAILGVRFKDSGQLEDLQDSIRYIEIAVNESPNDFPERARYLHDLGVNFYDRFQKQQDLHDLQLARECFSDCLGQNNATPLQRLRGGRKAAGIAIEQQAWQLAAAYLSQCIDLVPRISSRSSSHDDLHHILQQLSGLGPLAAWVYLRAGRSVIESLQALEQCRGIISSLIMDSRSDVSLLIESHPEVAARYCGLRKAVARQGLFNERCTLSFEKNSYLSDSLKLAHDLKNLEALEVKIRTLPGFERFQLPPTEDEMLDLSKNGPIVSVSLTNHGCQAFLIANNTIQYQDFPEVTSSDVIEHIPWQLMNSEFSSRDPKYIVGSSQADKASNAQGTASTQSAMIESMQWLWNTIVQPVLAEMGLLWETVPSSSLPCIYWVSSGPVALLPFHAAGNHGPGSNENTLSHLSSSYIPTLKMLHHSRKLQRGHNLIDKVLVVTMPTTPARPGTHHDPLNVDIEVDAIYKSFGNPNSVEILPNPEPCQVLEKLPEYSIVHFACHGKSNPKNPSQSALLLGKAVPAELSAENIRALNHESAQIAYLSACSTAKLGGYNLTDEVVHLASTFQLAGFRDVIGTLWEVDDDAAGKVAAKFYKYLLIQSPDFACRVSRALHLAITDLKQEEGNGVNISLWAAFVHFGP